MSTTLRLEHAGVIVSWRSSVRLDRTTSMLPWLHSDLSGIYGLVVGSSFEVGVVGVPVAA